MKVIKKGRKQKGWAKEFECTGKGNGGGGCSALLLVEQKDVFRSTRFENDGSRSYFATFICPECGVLTDIDENVTFRILDYVEWAKLQNKAEFKNEIDL